MYEDNLLIIENKEFQVNFKPRGQKILTIKYQT